MVKFNINDQKCYLRWFKAAITCVSKIDERLSIKNHSTNKTDTCPLTDSKRVHVIDQTISLFQRAIFYGWSSVNLTDTCNILSTASSL